MRPDVLEQLDRLAALPEPTVRAAYFAKYPDLEAHYIAEGMESEADRLERACDAIEEKHALGGGAARGGKTLTTIRNERSKSENSAYVKFGKCIKYSMAAVRAYFAAKTAISGNRPTLVNERSCGFAVNVTEYQA